MSAYFKKISQFLASKWMFVGTLVLFGLETVSIALTSRFPMPFDEGYHYGLVRFFSTHNSLIVTNQPSSTHIYGALEQSPSLLYHYLLSFPYRFVSLFTDSISVHIIVLRLFSIIFVLFALVAMRKILRLCGLSALLSNLVMFVVALTPMMTVLSAQINYDSLFILFASLSIYATLLLLKQLKRDHTVNAKTFSALVCVCLYGSLVKYAFLPILLGIAITLAAAAAFAWRQQRRLKIDHNITGLPLKLFFAIAVLLGLFLFARIYGVNVVRYHTPVPQCNQVLNVEACKQYYAWDANYLARQRYLAHPEIRTMNLLEYTGYWSVTYAFFLIGTVMPLKGLMYMSIPFFVIFGLLVFCGLTGVLINYKKLLKDNRLLLVPLFIGAIYILALWARNYHDYLQLGHLAAINGRYVLPVIAYFYALVALGIYHAFKSRTYLEKAAVVGLVLVSFLYFGGFTQYMWRVNPVYGWGVNSQCAPEFRKWVNANFYCADMQH